MKPEYDFTKGERGKFFRPDAEIRLPIYLDTEVQNTSSNGRRRRACLSARW